MLHIQLLTADAATPSYLLTCGRTFQRTILDPLHPADAAAALGQQPLDLILLTTPTLATLAAAHKLHRHTGAPVLASASASQQATAAHLPLARKLGDADIVGLGPLAQTLAVPAPLNEDGHPQGQDVAPTARQDIMLYAIGSAHVLFAGALFTETPRRPLPFLLKNLPEDLRVFGGHAPEATLADAPTLGQLMTPASTGRAAPPHPAAVPHAAARF